ncbi:MAG: rhodanese-like domain-containing protein [Acidaminococcaceae bacterium]|jgi:rhodanese-related sulfurtransferase|nr:rhodanese-like domain-containing protein [Acidaminococcaceae bacterium]
MRKIVASIILLLVVILGGTSLYLAEAKNASFQIIDYKKAKVMMDNGGVTVVDVRRQDEYDAGHIKNAILVPNESIGKTEPKLLPDKNAILLVYCRTGIRAKDASQKLANLGYKNVYDFGGIVDWPYEKVK